MLDWQVRRSANGFVMLKIAVVVRTIWLWVKTALAYFSGDLDVHWGYDLDFDPWPY